MMRLPFISLIRASGALLLLMGCARDTSHTDGSDSLTGRGTGTAKVTDAYASDGSLSILASVVQQRLLRPAADSFGGREAIRVVFVPLADSGTQQSSGSYGDADLIVISAIESDRVFPDSLPWLLPFAEVLPDSSSIVFNDSASLQGTNIPPHAEAKRRARTVRGRRADSIRADSVRREVARFAEERARADSARLLLLAIPETSDNRAVAERFVRYLLTAGRATLLQAGARVLPRLIVHGRGLPPGMVPMVDSVASGDSLSVSIRPLLPRQ